MSEIHDAIQDCRVLSGLILINDLSAINILVSNKNHIYVHKINRHNEDMTYRLNLPFWKISIDNERSTKFNDRCDIIPWIYENIMIVPMPGMNDTSDIKKFTIISENWKYMTTDSELNFYDPPTNMLFDLVVS